MCVCVGVRHDVAPGVALRMICGVCAAAGGSSRRPSRGREACCTPHPRARCLRHPACRPGVPEWSSARMRSSYAT